MDFTCTVKNDERTIGKLLFQYYLYIYAPRLVSGGLFFVMLLLFVISRNLGGLGYCILLALSLMILSEFPVWKRKVIRLFYSLGMFDHETILHFTDHSISVQSGECSAVYPYKHFSFFFIRQGVMYLVVGEKEFHLSSAFSEDMFPDRGSALVECLKNSGVCYLDFWEWKRWRVNILLLIVVVLYSLALAFFRF